MKKVILALAVVAFFTACNSGDSGEAAKVDSPKVDTAAVKVDTAAAKVDTAAAKVDTAAAKVDTAAAKK